jgi:hypothetical protein
MIEGAKMMAHNWRVGRAALLEQNLDKAAVARARQRAQAGRRDCSPLPSGALLRLIHQIEGRTAKASPAIEHLPPIARPQFCRGSLLCESEV